MFNKNVYALSDTWFFLFGRVTPSSENPNGATCSVSQGKPSLRRIKGRIHRSKSLDSIDFCEFTVSTVSFTFILWEVLRILLIKQLSLLHWIYLFVRIREGIILNAVAIAVLPNGKNSDVACIISGA